MTGRQTIFSYPKMLFAERVIQNAGMPVYIDQDELRTDRDMLVDYIWVNFYTPNDILPDRTLTQYLWVNWAIGDNEWWFSQDTVSASFLQSHWDSDRTTNVGAALNISNPTLVFRHKPLWEYPSRNRVSIQWYQTGENITPGLQMGVGFNGVGTHSGRRRLFQMNWTIPADAVGVQNLVANTIPSTINNNTNEVYKVETSHIVLTGTNALPRTYLGYYRLRVLPSWGDPWSYVPVPLLMYAPNIDQNNCGIWHRPSGGPFLLKAKDKIKFRIRGFQTATAQIGIIGRVAYGSNTNG